MRPLPAQWPAVQKRVLRARHILLCCDFDGTLVPIASHPACVRLPARTRMLLQRLAVQPKLSLMLISGRRLSELKRLVGIRRAYYGGNHGLELEGGGMRRVDPAAQRLRPILRQIARRLRARLRAAPGTWIEDKGLSLSMHVRQVETRDRRTAERLFQEMLRPLQEAGSIRITIGKLTWEVRPATDWNKGSAIRWLADLEQERTGECGLIIAVGDDQTDEDAFREANRRHGLSILIGDPTRKSAAQHRLRSPSETQRWLAALSQTL